MAHVAEIFLSLLSRECLEQRIATLAQLRARIASWKMSRPSASVRWRFTAADARMADRRFQVAGHTDNHPIRHSGYASNWELSSERALQVTRFLMQSGMPPATLSAAAYGEYDPVIENDAPEHEARNRRIEITLQPRIDELPSLPE